MLVLMWLAVLPLDTDPFMDDHLVYAVAMLLLAHPGAGRTWGLGDRWTALPRVQGHRWREWA